MHPSPSLHHEVTIYPSEPNIYSIFEPVISTWQYIVADPDTKEAAIIDSVLDFDPATNCISTKTADNLLSIISSNKLIPILIMETHVIADHLTAARYLQNCLSEQGYFLQIAIGKRITEVQGMFGTRYHIPKDELCDVFNILWEDNQKFKIGNLDCEVLHLPGHTPDHVGYRIEDNVFTGDSIFNPDVGSAQADFPGGSVAHLWRSTQILLGLPGHYRLYTGHDYPPSERNKDGVPVGAILYTTVEEQRSENKHVKARTQEESFIEWRVERDATLGEPRLLHQSLQFNIRGGRHPRENEFGDRLVQIPLKIDKRLLAAMM